MPAQIKLVATGWHLSTGSYLESTQAKADRPGFVVDRDGTIHGSGGEGNVIAIVNAGPVVLHGGQWFPALPDTDGRFGRIAGAEPVRAPYEYCTCKLYHGCQFYEMIGDRQLQSLRRLLASLLSQFHIAFPYDNQLGNVCPRAIAGGTGIYFASSYDKHRSDIHPQIELLNLIKSLAR
jgi:hypothetical protein